MDEAEVRRTGNELIVQVVRSYASFSDFANNALASGIWVHVRILWPQSALLFGYEWLS